MTLPAEPGQTSSPTINYSVSPQRATLSPYFLRNVVLERNPTSEAVDGGGDLCIPCPFILTETSGGYLNAKEMQKGKEQIHNWMPVYITYDCM